MSTKPKRPRRYPEWENTCNYCLYLQPVPNGTGSGNCTYHRQWISRSAFSTCSDMSAQRLEEGIYTLTTSAYGAWTYQRRKQPIRPRLFLVPARPPADADTQTTENPPRTKKRMT